MSADGQPRRPATRAEVRALRTRTAEALAELNRVSCTDPAARGALRAIRLTALTLERFWLPALDALAPSRPDDAPRG